MPNNSVAPADEDVARITPVYVPAGTSTRAAPGVQAEGPTPEQLESIKVVAKCFGQACCATVIFLLALSIIIPVAIIAGKYFFLKHF